MKKQYLVLLMLALLPAFGACKKEEGKPAPAQPEAAIVRTWKIKRVLQNGVEDKATNYGAVRLEFKTGGTYTLVESTGTRSGTWELVNNNADLLMNKGESNEERRKVLRLTGSELNLEYTTTNYKNGTVTWVYEYIPA